MKKNYESLTTLNVFFSISVVVSNIVASKVIKIGWFVVPSAVFAYAITFLITDIIDEIWGKNEAQKTVWRGFFAQIFSSILILTAQWLPVAPFMPEQQNHFVAVLGQNWRFAIASLIAYLISQSIDVNLFSFFGKLTRGKKKWIRNNFSTMTSQFIDTMIFITIAFFGVVPNLWQMIMSQYLLKLIIAAVDTPFFYLFTKGYIFDFES
ncbi:transporter [Thermosipho melanesiensis]|uniref:Probable queuosine precursor transporter n=1 Tax=Thermosipho melanesiensis TaxID=46541 RepID=A0ABM6GCL1_9BACT|nr:transporter [Thermosipho melanesiensis]OOC38740.1 transporter [Thermosipho melanesiensis]OOC40545.1 transporter [Thermosipho melanesiensis]OOC40808.1 transporter [Thermosipho melanesiensis]OOC44655.1 transporter [Thermosipho melanesiensis]